MTEVNEETTAPVVTEPVMTEAAYTKAKELLDKEEASDIMLRLGCSPGGCSGLRYSLSFSNLELEGDYYFEQPNGLMLVIDRMSYPYLNTVTVDFVDKIDKQGFTLDNPLAENTCGCGDSFS